MHRINELMVKMLSEYKIIFIIFMICINLKSDLISQKYSIGVSTEIGYEFYSRFTKPNEVISNTFNPTLGLGIISEIQGSSGILLSLEFNMNKSQRKYLFTYSKYIESIDFYNWTYEDVNKIINSYNLTFGLGYRKNKFKFIMGPQFTRVLEIKDFDATIIRVRGVGGLFLSDQIDVNSKSKTTLNFVSEVKFLVSNNLNFSLKYVIYPGKNSYSSNAPLGRITIGVQQFLITKKVSTVRNSTIQ